MRLLILGGTKFLGKHVAAHALQEGHEVTLFTRGETNPELFPGAEKLRGDRDGNLVALGGREWDVVIDTSGYVPRIVRDSAEALAGSVGRYVFVSTISVYAEANRPGIDESGKVATLTEATEEVTGETYGALKALCEQEVAAAFGERASSIRAGLIVGPDDPTDRFTYWPVRIEKGGDVVAPAPADRQIQFVDVRDLARWMVDAELSGIYNGTGPAGVLTMGDLLDGCVRVTGSDAAVRWVDEAFLLEHGVEPWSELPLWIPSTDGDSSHALAIDNSHAVEAGLTFTALDDTIRDTLAWHHTRPTDHEWLAGFDAEKERQVLADLRATDL